MPAPPSRPTVWPVFAALLAAFLVDLVGTAVLVVAVAAVRARGQGVQAMSDAAVHFAFSAPGILAAAIVSEATFLVTAIVTASVLGRDVPGQLRLRPSRASAAGYAAAVLGTLAVSLATGAATDFFHLSKAGATMEAISSSLAHASPVLFALAVLLLGVSPGVAEETFFRGLMQGRLKSRLGPWPAIVITAACFGLVHLDWVQSPLAFLLGLYLGWSAERLGGIRPTMVAHAVNNALFVAASVLGGSSAAEGSQRDDLVAMIAGSAVFVLATALLQSPRALRESYSS